MEAVSDLSGGYSLSNNTAYDAIIAGGGPAGLAAAEVLARHGCATLVLEQNHEIGSPIRTSGGSFIDELEALSIPAALYHPISRVRFLSAGNAAVYDYSQPRMCVIDVRGVFQHLASKAVDAGAAVRVASKAEAPVIQNDAVVGVRTRSELLRAQVVIDATGYRSALLKQAGLDPGIGDSAWGLNTICTLRIATSGKRCFWLGAIWRPPAMPGCFLGAGTGFEWGSASFIPIRMQSRMRIWTRSFLAPLVMEWI